MTRENSQASYAMVDSNNTNHPSQPNREFEECESFFSSIQTALLPAIERLFDSLDSDQTVVQQSGPLIRDAEEWAGF